MDAESSSSANKAPYDKNKNNNNRAEGNGALASPTSNLETISKARRRRRLICLTVTVALLGLGLLFLTLGLTVFKAKKPVTTVNSVALSDLSFSVNIAQLRVLLNVSLDVDVSVRNPNRVGFRYGNSTAILRYRGGDVGVVPIQSGRIGARETRSLNLTLTVMADRLLADSALYSDAISGTVPFQTYIRIAGKVRILFNIHLVTYTTCDLQIDLASRNISSQECQYRTRL